MCSVVFFPYLSLEFFLVVSISATEMTYNVLTGYVILLASTSAKEVMFSYVSVCLLVCLSVC